MIGCLCEATMMEAQVVETQSSGTAQCVKKVSDYPGQLDVGSQVKVTCDYTAIREDEISVSKGELIQILSTNQHGSYLVHRPSNESSPAAEGWIPVSVLLSKESDNGVRKPWHQAFRIRKPSFGKKEGKSSLERRKGISRMMHPDIMFEAVPTFQETLCDIYVHEGESVIMTCRVCGRPRPCITWRGPDRMVLRDSETISMTYTEEGVATLEMLDVVEAQSGEYSCVARSPAGTEATVAILYVIADKPGVPGPPSVKEQTGSSIVLEWDPPVRQEEVPVSGYCVEYLSDESGTWTMVGENITESCYTVEELPPGAAYQFRVLSQLTGGPLSEPSEPSDILIIPEAEDAAEEAEDEDDPLFVDWKNTFDADFTDLSEIGRGRFSVIKKCTQIASGQVMAAKFVSKKLCMIEQVELEFTTLQNFQNPQILQVLDLYDTPSSHVILMEMLPNGCLFNHICSKPQFDEVQAATYMFQILDVIQYLHNCRIAHLDIKPENFMVDLSSMSTQVKLIDFGDARAIYNTYYVHTLMGSPEFAAPELVSGNPVGLLTDIWSTGVVAYVLLSGVSPFLDESLEETCSNILRRDFCFPEEYFRGISDDAKDFISSMLVEDIHQRPSALVCMEHAWIQNAMAQDDDDTTSQNLIPTERLLDFIERRKHQHDTQVLTPVKHS